MNINNNNFKLDVLNKLDHLYNYGFRIEEHDYTINKVINIYVKIMKSKVESLGQTYTNNMIKDIENIINNLDENSPYDNLEFVNTIINYCIKTLHFKYKKNDIEPMFPDYTIDEIRDMVKH